MQKSIRFFAFLNMYKSYTVNKNDAGQRLDKFLTKTVKALPQSMMYKALRTKKIKVNRKRAEPGSKLCEGDVIELYLKDDFFAADAVEASFKSLKPSLEVVYEDDNILVCNKRQGLIVHSDDKEDINTLINHIKAYLFRKGQYLPDNENSFAPALCNRIDRNTGGLVIAAKNAVALRVMNEKIKNNEIVKRYVCAVRGVPKIKSATLKGYLIKDSESNMVTVYDEPQKNCECKTIITKYDVIKEKNSNSLLEVELITGRTHQIRAHMAKIGHPLLGDGKYGINRDEKKQGYKFQALYSRYIRFNFKDPECEMSYLNNKEISIPYDQIWFVKDFID